MDVFNSRPTENTNVTAVSVVIAARDEEVGIGLSLQSILAQEGVGEIIVVDDHSTDRTAEVVRAVADEHDVVRLVAAPALPPGWTGKTHALHVGSSVARCDYILFTDADVVFSGKVVSDVVQRMEEERLDFAGGLFAVRCSTVAEKVCAPVLAAMARIAMSLTAGRLGAGTGAFGMVRKTMYLAAGGHAAIRDRIVDDVALARLMRSHSKNTVFLPETSRYVQVRLFEGWRGYWRAIARSAVPFLGGRRRVVIPMSIGFLMLAVCLCLLPVLAAWNLICGSIRGVESDLVLGALQLAGFVVGAVTVGAAQGCSSGSRLWSMLYPIPFMVMVLAVLWTAVRMTFVSGVSWRGRVYGGKPAKPKGPP